MIGWNLGKAKGEKADGNYMIKKGEVSASPFLLADLAGVLYLVFVARGLATLAANCFITKLCPDRPMVAVRAASVLESTI
jgi:hypothetical protein